MILRNACRRAGECATRLLPPAHLEQPYRLLEALQGCLALIHELEALVSSQLLDDIRDKYLTRLGVEHLWRVRQLKERLRQAVSAREEE